MRSRARRPSAGTGAGALRTASARPSSRSPPRPTATTIGTASRRRRAVTRDYCARPCTSTSPTTTACSRSPCGTSRPPRWPRRPRSSTAPRPSPTSSWRRWAQLGWMGIPFPEEVGGAGGTTLQYALAVEELTRVDSSVAITMCAHTSLGTQPVYLFGSDEQKQRLLPDLCSGAQARRVRPDRARGGLRRRQRQDARGARRRRVGRSTAPSSSSPTPGPTSPATSRSPHGPARRRSRTSSSRTARPATSRAALPQDGLERLGHAPAHLRRLPRAGGEPARPARRRLQAVPAHPRHRPHRRRRDGRRPRAGRARRGADLRQGAPGLRPADLEVPGDPGQARRHGHRDRGRAPAHLQGGAG